MRSQLQWVFVNTCNLSHGSLSWHVSQCFCIVKLNPVRHETLLVVTARIEASETIKTSETSKHVHCNAHAGEALKRLRIYTFAFSLLFTWISFNPTTGHPCHPALTTCRYTCCISVSQWLNNGQYSKCIKMLRRPPHGLPSSQTERVRWRGQ